MLAIGTLAIAPTLAPFFGRFGESISIKRASSSKQTDAADAPSSSCYKPTFHFESVEQLYTYAAAITNSRHFTNDEYVAMLPVFDLFNGM